VPVGPPPPNYNGDPHIATMAAGLYYRVHRNNYPATGFNPTNADVVFGGGRFDSTVLDPYAYMYLGETYATGVAEALLRDLTANDRGYRFLPKKTWRERSLTTVSLTTPLDVVDLRSGVALGAIGADPALTGCDSDEYPQTRSWARWLRTIAPTAAGIVWMSKREPMTECMVLFADRCPAGAIAGCPPGVGEDHDFSTADGSEWLRGHLAQYRVSIKRT
jgi:hypothetical protein